MRWQECSLSSRRSDVRNCLKRYPWVLPWRKMWFKYLAGSISVWMMSIDMLHGWLIHTEATTKAIWLGVWVINGLLDFFPFRPGSDGHSTILITYLRIWCVDQQKDLRSLIAVERRRDDHLGIQHEKKMRLWQSRSDVASTARGRQFSDKPGNLRQNGNYAEVLGRHAPTQARCHHGISNILGWKAEAAIYTS
jgi:hypothetical protein